MLTGARSILMRSLLAKILGQVVRYGRAWAGQRLGGAQSQPQSRAKLRVGRWVLTEAGYVPKWDAGA